MITTANRAIRITGKKTMDMSWGECADEIEALRIENATLRDLCAARPKNANAKEWKAWQDKIDAAGGKK